MASFEELLARLQGNPLPSETVIPKNCPHCGKTHRAFPKQCVREVNITYQLTKPYTLVYGLTPQQEEYVQKEQHSFEKSDTNQKYLAMQRYLQQNFPR